MWRRERGRAYTWLRERESGERVKASEEGAGIGGVGRCEIDKGEKELAIGDWKVLEEK